MIKFITFSRVSVCVFTTCLTLLITSSAMAQEVEVVQGKTAEATDAVKGDPVKVKRQFRVHQGKPSASNRVSKLQANIKQCGAPCDMSGADSITAGEGGTRDHECDDNGNCHCFGAIDCVAMSKICAPDTLGCNDQGCLCKEGEGDGG